METNLKYKNHFDRQLAFNMIDIEATRRKIINKVIVAKLLNIATVTVFLSIFMGFLNAFPFEEFGMAFITYVFQGFFYLVLIIVVFGILQKAIQYILEIRGAKELLENKTRIYVYTAIASIITISIASVIGHFYLGVVFGTVMFFVRYILAFAALLFLAFLSYAFGSFEKEFIQNFKSEILPKILAFFNPAIKFDPNNFIKQASFDESCLFRHMEIYSYNGSDGVMGSYGEGNFEFSQLVVMQRTTSSSGGKTETKISELFKGLFYVADFNKTFSGRTVIFPDYARQVLGMQFGEMLNRTFEFDNTHLVTLEDTEFEKQFAVYSTDQVEARYILSPFMIERIKTIKSKLEKDTYFSFINNKLYIAVPSDSDSLTPFIFHDMTNFETIEPIYQIIGTLLDISKDLQLNTRIWGKV